MRGTKRLVAAGVLGMSLGLGALAVPAAAQEGEMELTGPVTNLSGTCPELQFTIASQQVMTHSQTEFDDGVCEDIVNGLGVEVEGTLGSDGVLVASEVDLEVQ